MLIPFVLRDVNSNIVEATPTVLVDGESTQVQGSPGRWEVEAPPGSLITITAPGAVPLDMVAPYVTEAAIEAAKQEILESIPKDVPTLSQIEASTVLAKEMSATTNKMDIQNSIANARLTVEQIESSAILAKKSDVQAIGELDVDVSLLSAEIAAAVGGSLGEDIANDIMARMSLHESLSIGPGVGSVKFEDTVFTRAGRPADGAVIRIFNKQDGQVDFTQPVAGAEADSAGNYYVMLNPGTYARRIWYKRTVVLDDSIDIQ